MINKTKPLALLVPLLLLAGCNTTPLSNPAEAPWDRIALVVVADNVLHGSKVGLTVFNNAFVDWEVPDLDLAAKLTPILSEALETGFGWEVDGRQDWRASFDSEGKNAHLAASLDYPPTAALLAKARDEGYDALVVLAPHSSADDLGGSNQRYSGFGLYQRTALVKMPTSVVAVAKMQFHPLNSPTHGEARYAPLRFSATEPMKSVIEFKAEWSDYTEDEQQRILDAVDALVRGGFRFEVQREVQKLAPARNSPFAE